MRRTHAAVSLVLAASATVGLGVLLLHIEGLALLAHGAVVAIGLAVAIILAVGGFFLGVLYRSRAADEEDGRAAVHKLSEALALERRLRVEAARDRYHLRQDITALEGQVRAPNAQPLPPAEVAEMPLSDDDLDRSDELEELAATCEKLRKELAQRKQRMADLEAELSLVQAEADDLKSRSAAPDPVAETAFQGESLTAVLDGLVARPGVHVALVADDQGLVVDTAGEALEPDTLAAISGVVAELSPRVTDLLPLGEIATVALGDVTGRVMEVRYFLLLGSRCALVVIRDEAAGAAELGRGAVDAIAERLAR